MTPRWPAVPDFGTLLATHIEGVPVEGLPLLLAGLERAAAARYRSWAEQLPNHAPVLGECAAREDEIADLVTGIFPISDECRSAVDAALPGAVEAYYAVFAPHPIRDQLYLQSEAELQGSRAWADIAAQVHDPFSSEVLARCVALEEESALAVKGLLDEIA